MVQEFRQKEGLDFFDIYSPVTRINTIRLLIEIATLKDFEIHQMYVKFSFLNKDLEEETYIKRIEGFVILGQKHKICTLMKSFLWAEENTKLMAYKF